MSMIQYMTTYSEAYFDHDTIYDNDGIKRLVPNLLIAFQRCSDLKKIKNCPFVLLIQQTFLKIRIKPTFLR